MRLIRPLAVLALATACLGTSACAGPDTNCVKKVVPPCNLEKKIIVMQDPPPVVVKIYVCGKCGKEFKYSKENPYCIACVKPQTKRIVVMPPEEQEIEIIRVEPPCPPRRGAIYVEEWPSTYYYQRPWYRESFSETHSTTHKREWRNYYR